ncbi:MAG: VWA domain-containing protein [Promethearchaeota archaeon]
MSEIVEDTVLVLDLSRSMSRTDLHPSRLVCCKHALIKFIRRKLEINPQNQIGIVGFGEKARKVLFFSKDQDVIENTIRNMNVEGGVSYIGAGIALGIQMHVDMLRQISGKIARMLVLSDGRFKPNTAMDPIKMAKLAQGLGIQIDTINIGIEDSFQVLKQIAELTGGEYLNISEPNILYNAITSLSAILPEETREYLKSKKPLLSDLAGELVSISDMSSSQKALVEQLSQAQREKCLICFKSDCEVCKQPFFSCGRYCPNCGSPMHLHCAAKWAAADTKTDSNVFRCPHCFYLLKVPAEIQKVEELREQIRIRKEYESKSKKHVATRAETKPARENNIPKELVNKVTPQEIGADIATMVCPVCEGIFEDEEFLYECGNLDCSALYHPKCFEKLKNKNGKYACRNCGHILEKFD